MHIFIKIYVYKMYSMQNSRSKIEAKIAQSRLEGEIHWSTQGESVTLVEKEMDNARPEIRLRSYWQSRKMRYIETY